MKPELAAALVVEELVKFAGFSEEEADKYVEEMSDAEFDACVVRTLHDRLDSNNFDTRNRRRGYR